MASGSFSVTVGNRKGMENEYIKVWWSSKPDPANNRSLVRVYAKMYRPYPIYVDYNQRIELYINGVKYTGSRYGWRGSGWTEAYIDKSVWIPHNADGKRSVNIRLRTEVKAWLRSYVGWVDTGTHSCRLDNLARKSTFTIDKTSADIGEQITVKLNRSSSAVRHAISLKVGNKVVDILKKENDNGSTTAYPYTLSPTTLLPAMTGKTVTSTVTVTTYNGSASLGSDSKTFNLNLRSTDVPSLGASNVIITPRPISPNTATDCYIYNKTGAKITVTPTASPGSHIKNYTVKLNGKTYNYSSSPIIIDALTKVGDNSIEVYVTDDRGMTSSVVKKNIAVLEYSNPTLSSFTANRCNADGTLNKSGTSIKVSFKYKISPCNKHNSATITLYERNPITTNDYSKKFTWTISSTDPYSNTIEKVFSTYPVDNSFDFKLDIKDAFNSTGTSMAEIGTEELLADFSPTGVAIGKVVERDRALEVVWNSYFEGTIYGTVQANTSDERLKTVVYDDVEPLLRIWDNLSVVLFKYNRRGDDKIQIGLIAQEVIKLFEHEGLDWRKYGVVYEDPDTGYYSINYQFINQLSMVKAKIMQLQLLKLESRLDALEANR